MDERQYCVYIMTNKASTVLYTGFSGNLPERVMQHKSKVVESFTKRYSVNRLVYYEVTDDVDGAMERERQIKAGSRKKKMDLIDAFNPTWRDLSAEL